MGCSDSVTKIVNINPAPLASFTLANACFNDSVHFVNTSTIGQGTLTSWNWGFGDGNTSTQQNPAHLYDSVKVYTVTLAVTSDSGCTSTATNTVAIKAGPLAGFATSSVCGSTKVSFTDTSFVAGPDSITTWNWTFGNGSTSTQQNPANTYTTTGTYTVLLQVQTSSGCMDTASAVINLGQNVVADYIPAGGTYNTGQSIVFTNQSTGASGYNWSFGNGDTSVVTNPSYAYTQPGTYTVVLIASNSLGCMDTVEYVFEVNTHGVTVPTGFTPNGDGLNDYFYVMGGPFSSYELRVFNEWGNQIFLSNAQSDKWDGTIGGTKQPAGTYIYIFNGKTADGQTIKLQKDINLIR
jgi:gliding motility-associated-like protein